MGGKKWNKTRPGQQTVYLRFGNSFPSKQWQTKIALCTSAGSLCRSQQVYKFGLLHIYPLKILLKPQCRIAGSPSDVVVHIQPRWFKFFIFGNWAYFHLEG